MSTLIIYICVCVCVYIYIYILYILYIYNISSSPQVQWWCHYWWENNFRDHKNFEYYDFTHDGKIMDMLLFLCSWNLDTATFSKSAKFYFMKIWTFKVFYYTVPEFNMFYATDYISEHSGYFTCLEYCKKALKVFFISKKK